MKIIAAFILLLVSSLGGKAQECPDWVKRRPVNSMYYTGIARVSRTQSDYMEEAKNRALRDLASEIKVTVNASSLLKTLEQNGVAGADYEETIRTEVGADIEKYELVDSWQDDKEYWVYYRLNRFDYEEYMTQRRERSIRTGFDYWYKGEVALQQGELWNAAGFFLKGLDAVKVVANEELTCEYDGQTMDIGRELYASLNRVFNGINITALPALVEGQAFQGIGRPVKLKVSRNGVPLKNLLLEYRFTVGAGQLSGPVPTDREGETELYIRNITSKLSEQEIRIAPDRSAFARFKKGVYQNLLENLWENIPQCILYVRIGQTQLNAYLMPAAHTDGQMKDAVVRVLTDRYFNMVATPGEADLLVRMKTDFRKGETVAGDMRDLVAYYAGISLRIENNRNGQVVADYALNDVKILQPSTASAEAAEGAAVRELTRRMQGGLKKALAGLNIGKEGERNAAPRPEETEVPAEEKRVNPEVKPVVIVIGQSREKEPGKPASAPADPPSAREPKPVEGELLPGFFIRYVSMKQMQDRTILTLTAINRTEDDRELYLTSDRVKVINEKGEEAGILKMRIGSVGHGNWARALIVQNVPTAVVFELKPLQEAALVQIKDGEGHVVKLRNIK